MENETIGYDINVKGLIDVLKEHDCARIEFYDNGTYEILSWNSFGYPEEAIFTEEYYLRDFEECGGNIKDYVDWLEGLWLGDVNAYKHGEFLATVHINWIYEN